MTFQKEYLEAKTCKGDAAYADCPLKWGFETCAKARTELGEAACKGEDCKSYYKLLNDPSGAKPPFLDDYEMEIVDDSDSGSCKTAPGGCECYTGAATALKAVTHFSMVVVLLFTCSLL